MLECLILGYNKIMTNILKGALGAHLAIASFFGNFGGEADIKIFDTTIQGVGKPPKKRKAKQGSKGHRRTYLCGKSWAR